MDGHLGIDGLDDLDGHLGIDGLDDLDGHLGINDWDFILFEQCETHKQLKERETFWQHRLKTFYPLSLRKRSNYISIPDIWQSDNQL